MRTVKSGLANFAPSATGTARPCRLWIPYVWKKPGKFDEQPIPETVRMSLGCSPRSAQAFCKELSTPKSPQDGHQSGLTCDLKSSATSCLPLPAGVRVGGWKVASAIAKDVLDVSECRAGIEGFAVVL